MSSRPHDQCAAARPGRERKQILLHRSNTLSKRSHTQPTSTKAQAHLFPPDPRRHIPCSPGCLQGSRRAATVRSVSGKRRTREHDLQNWRLHREVSVPQRHRPLAQACSGHADSRARFAPSKWNAMPCSRAGSVRLRKPAADTFDLPLRVYLHKLPKLRSWLGCLNRSHDTPLSLQGPIRSAVFLLCASRVKSPPARLRPVEPLQYHHQLSWCQKPHNSLAALSMIAFAFHQGRSVSEVLWLGTVI